MNIIIFASVFAAAYYCYQRQAVILSVLKGAFKIPVGLQALVFGITSLYCFCAFLSINTKFTAIATGSDPSWVTFFVNCIKTIPSVFFTDFALHYSLPTGVVFLCIFLFGTHKDRNGNATGGLKIVDGVFGIVAVGIATAATVIDYNICHETGDIVGSAEYEKTATKAVLQTVATAAATMQAPTITTAKAATDPNLSKLAAKGNDWASGKMAEMKNRFSANQAATQLKAVQAAASANSEIAKAEAEKAKTVQKANAVILQREDRDRKRAEKKERQAQNKYTYKSVISSAGSFVMLFVCGIIAYMTGAHRDPNFSKIGFNIFKVGSEPKIPSQTVPPATTTAPPVTIETQPVASATAPETSENNIGKENETSETSEKELTVQDYINKYLPKDRADISVQITAINKAVSGANAEYEKYKDAPEGSKHAQKAIYWKKKHTRLADAKIELIRFLNEEGANAY